MGVAKRFDARYSAIAAFGAFALLYTPAFMSLVRDWLHDPEAGHGLLLAPIAVFYAWKRGLAISHKAQPVLGSLLIGAAVILTYMAELAAELFTLRMSMLIAAAGLIVFFAGFRQLVRWWLSVALLVLSVPLPAVILAGIALPLQLQASEMGAGLLAWRHVPVMLAGNVIRLPGQALFVTEACSGLRSLSALIALGLLMGSMFLNKPVSRVLILLLSVPVAVLINGVRVFLTGFIVYYGDPKLATGFMHMTEGWALFLVAFAALGAITAVVSATENWVVRRKAHA
jgi:exosortase